MKLKKRIDVRIEISFTKRKKKKWKNTAGKICGHNDQYFVWHKVGSSVFNLETLMSVKSLGKLTKSCEKLDDTGTIAVVISVKN